VVCHSACRELQVEGSKSKGRGRKTWNEGVKVDMKRCGLVKDDAHNHRLLIIDVLAKN